MESVGSLGSEGLFALHDAKTGFARIWEVDFVRGIALILMVLFHLLFDMREFFGLDVAYDKGIYYFIGKTAGILFILISAVSCTFSRSNNKRAVKILLLALLVSVISHLYNFDYGIKFGILHFLALSILLYPIFKEFRAVSLIVIGTLVIIMGNYLDYVPVTHNYLFIFNLTANSWVSGDYYPLFPWFGVFLYGMAIGKMLYRNRKSLFSKAPQGNIINYLGRHTLSVYLLHQPLLIALIYTFIKIRAFF